MRICQGTVTNCQPDIDELENIWRLALRGIDAKDRVVTLAYFDGEDEITRTSLGDLVLKARTPPTLDNLTLSAWQADPRRKISIQVGLGRETYVFVEADDPVWAIKRYDEVLGGLASTVRWYSYGKTRVSNWWEKTDVTEFGHFVLEEFIFWLFVPALLATIAFVEPLWHTPLSVTTELTHHHHVSGAELGFLAADLSMIAVLVWLVALVVAASRSRVIVAPRPIRIARRLGLLTVTMAAIGGVLAVIGEVGG
jgi:hypothetical protein